MMVSSHRVQKRLYVVTLQFDLQKLIGVQETFVCVAHLETLVEHPCHLPSHEKVLVSLGIFFSNEDSSFEMCVDDLLEITRYFRIKKTSMFVCHLAQVTACDAFESAIDVAESISLIPIIASIGRLAHEDTSLQKFIRKLRTQVFQLPLSGKFCPSPVLLAPHKNM